MKKTQLLSLALACMLSLSQTVSGQKVSKDEWRKQIQSQETIINDYVAKKLSGSNNEALLKQFYASIEHGDKHKTTDLPKMLDLYLKNHYRTKYLQENPGVISTYNPGRIELQSSHDAATTPAANIRSVACFNGDFESDPSLSDYTGYTGPLYFGNECAFVPPTAVAYTPTSLFTSPNEFVWTNNTPDPLIPALNQTNNNSAHAMRINGPGPCSPSYGVNMLQRSFNTPGTGLYQISFSYALVMENPKGHPNVQPFFVARVLDGSGTEVGSRICRVSDLTNPIYNITGPQPNPTGCFTTDSLVWRDWTCASIQFQGNPFQTYTIEFFAVDCGYGGHFGYAYVDDICASQCCPKFFARNCCELHGGSTSAAASMASANDPNNDKMREILAEYSKKMADKYNLPANPNSPDPCCNPCAYPNDPYPVFIMDEFNNMISSSDYSITWSHDPGNSSAYAYILPNQQTIVTVKGPGTCVWTDTIKLNCCKDTITITPFCTWDPCKYPTSPFPVRVLDHNGNPMTSAGGYSFFWQYGSGTSTGDAITATLADFPVIVTVKDANCQYTDTLDINCCTADTPKNPRCKEATNGSHLVWDAVPGTTYQVVITVGDPDCCGPFGQHPYTVTWNVAGTDTLVPTTFARCFSWYVVSICPDGSKSQASDKVCSCAPVIPCTAKQPVNLKCNTLHTGSQLSWDPIPGATFRLYINVNDPSCCRTNNPGYTMVWNVAGTDTIVPSIPANCFSWYVESICPDGSTSQASVKMCSCSPYIPCDPKQPTNLKCDETRSGSQLSWDLVPNAYYKVVITVNDPNCCRSVTRPYSIVWTVFGTDTIVPTSIAGCFSWYVVSVCPDGSESEKSELMCSCSPPVTPGHCDDPYKLDCSYTHGGNLLSWAIPAGAGGYELEITYNDPSCCIAASIPNTVLIGLSTNSYFVAPGTWNCFSWRVRAKCNLGGYSNWVSGGCNCSSVIIISPTHRQGNSDGNSTGAAFGKNISVEVVPNPASDFVNFNLHGLENVQAQSLEISIYDITGREVSRKSVNTDAKVKFDVTSLSTGMYIYKLTSKGELFYSGKIMIERK